MAKLNLIASLFISSALLLSACGGSPPAADGPGDVDAPADPTDDVGAPADGGDSIVRDADGDGKPDDTASGGEPECDGKTETQCKISAGCAWTGEGKCAVDKSGGM